MEDHQYSQPGECKPLGAHECNRPPLYRNTFMPRPGLGWIPRLTVVALPMILSGVILGGVYGIKPTIDYRRECEAIAHQRFGDGLYPFDYEEREDWHSWMEQEFDIEIDRRPTHKQLEMFLDYAHENAWPS